MIVDGKSLVSSVQERCRVCYTCVRECPAKAIRIVHGQASVIPERCIGCGNCVRVCGRNAKEVFDSLPAVRCLLSAAQPVAAILAPSFPAEFTEVDHCALAGMLRRLGFAWVVEAAAGAELVAGAYVRLIAERPSERYIATTCPAVVAYVEKYFPDLVAHLAPIVSPMVATARMLRQARGPALRTVFIGPCIAKKGEAVQPGLAGEIDAVLTFTELRRLLAESGIGSRPDDACDFDPPHPGRGTLFPIARGLLETAHISDDLARGDVIAADGRENFLETIKEFGRGDLKARLLEVLCCHGCIMGAGMTRRDAPLFRRREAVCSYARRRLAENRPLRNAEAIDLSRWFTAHEHQVSEPSEQKIRETLQRMGKAGPEDELNCGACGYETCRDHACAILTGFAESEMCLPYTIEQLKKTVQALADSNEEVATIQNALVQSEKLASVGQLAAGVAHEVNNPLGVVLMYAHLLLEKYTHDESLREDLTMIAQQADRCKRIVSGLLNFARQNKTIRQPTVLPDLVRETVKAVALSDTIAIDIRITMTDQTAEVDRDQLAQAMVNLITNAQAAMPSGGRLTIELSDASDHVIIRVSDTGIGIPAENLPRIFDPFFTTKQIGKGTGLGLAVLYGIIKMHCGSVNVVSNADPVRGPCGTTFTLKLPRREGGREPQLASETRP